MKSENKMDACLSDYHIHVSLNIGSHGPSQEFAEIVYPYSMYPCKTKPTRVTNKTASLINNQFCNNMTDSSLFTGILYTSYNFPIFYIDSSWTNTNCSHYFKQGKSEGFDSCDRPSNLHQNGSKSNFLATVTQKLAGWPRKTIGNFFLVPISHVGNFVAII